MKKNKTNTGQIVNRRASFDYQLGDDLVCGLVLNGKQVRAARDSHVQLKGSYVTVRDSEIWLNNASFTLKLNQKGGQENSVDTSPIKLLATRKQVADLESNKKLGMSIIPTKLLVSGRYIKLVIALGKGKKKYDKRQVIKKRDTERENRRILKG
jgi:SsrA-binding protein